MLIFGKDSDIGFIVNILDWDWCCFFLWCFWVFLCFFVVLFFVLFLLKIEFLEEKNVFFCFNFIGGRCIFNFNFVFWELFLFFCLFEFFLVCLFLNRYLWYFLMNVFLLRLIFCMCFCCWFFRFFLFFCRWNCFCIFIECNCL